MDDTSGNLLQDVASHGGADTLRNPFTGYSPHNALSVFFNARLSPHALPHLSIPSQTVPNDALLHTHTPETPETPASLSSPTGVVDLTRYIKTVTESPVTTGGFSDIYQGDWIREAADVMEGTVRKETVKVAIKLLRILAAKDQDGGKARKRLNREVNVWHRLEHPNIVKLFGTSYHMSGRPSMVMKWYENGCAAEYLRGPGLEVNRMSLVHDIAQGLNYLHTLSPPIVHGDLKGNNVLVTDDGHAVLSDFGLSQVIEDLVGPTGYTPSSPEVGPLRWQAPEFVEDEECQLGLETDVWSFGCTAYELLSGKIPYYYRSRDALIMRDMHNKIEPPGPDGIILDTQDNRVADLLYDACWSFTPSDRLQMSEIVLQVRDICANRKAFT